jgi:outer membrane protein assembly factor BamB
MRSFTTRLNISLMLTLLIVLVIGVALLGRTGLGVHAAGASITLTPNFGPPTSITAINGTGFGVSETVAISFDATSIGTATTDATGAFSANISVPATATPGNHTVTAKGQTSNLTAQATFLVQTDWSMFGYNAQQTHFNPYENVLSTSNVSGLKLDWSATTGNAISSSPAVVSGVTYFGSTDGKLYAYAAQTGNFKWSFTTGNAISSSPAVNNGIVYVGSTDGKLYAVDGKAGTMLWSYTTGNAISSSPIVAPGMVIVGSTDGKLYAIDPKLGTLLWSFTTGNAISSTPAMAPGMVFVSSTDGNIYALNAATGTQIWSFASGSSITSSPAVANGVVYIGLANGKVLALASKTGTQKWHFLTGDTNTFSSSPAVAKACSTLAQLTISSMRSTRSLAS